MQVQVRGKGVEVTDALREYAVRKVNKLENHFQNLTSATVTHCVEGRKQRVEVQILGDGLMVRAEDRHESDLYAAMDRVIDKIERQMQRYKARHNRNGHHHHHSHHDNPSSPRTAPIEIAGLSEPDEPVIGRIVRHKRFEIKPIAPAEAVAQMELLSHDFFVFENAETGEINVLYRREDKNYGILEPER